MFSCPCPCPCLPGHPPFSLWPQCSGQPSQPTLGCSQKWPRWAGAKHLVPLATGSLLLCLREEQELVRGHLPSDSQAGKG